MALSDTERQLLEETADKTVDGTLFSMHRAGIGDDIEDLVGSITRGADTWTNVLVGVLVRRLEEERGGDNSLASVRSEDYHEIKRIAEARRDHIRDSLIGM